TFTAAVAPNPPGSGTPTGTVTFNANGSPICSNVALSGAHAACTYTSQPGSVNITASYSGDNFFNGTTASLQGGPQTVQKAQSSVALVSSPNPPVAGQPATFTATVTAVAPGTGTPTGTATFTLNGTPVCTNVVLTGSQASCTIPSFPAGS